MKSCTVTLQFEQTDWMKVVRLCSRHQHWKTSFGFDSYRKFLLLLGKQKKEKKATFHVKINVYFLFWFRWPPPCKLYIAFLDLIPGVIFCASLNPFLFTLTCVTTVYLMSVCLVLHPEERMMSLFFFPTSILKFTCCFWNHFVLYSKKNDILF